MRLILAKAYDRIEIGPDWRSKCPWWLMNQPETEFLQLYYNCEYEEIACPHFSGDIYEHLYKPACTTRAASIMADVVHCFPDGVTDLSHIDLVDLRGKENQLCLMAINVLLTRK